MMTQSSTTTRKPQGESASPEDPSPTLRPQTLRYRLFAFVKECLAFVYVWCGYVPVRDLILSLLGRSRAVIVYYHRIGGLDQLSKPAGDFRRDLAYFKRWYECISLAELCSRLQSGEPLRRRCVVITFDDGYRDNFTQALPLLQEAGIPATFYVSTGYMGTERVFPHDALASGRDADFPKLSWDEVRRMEVAGFEIGSHTVNHTNLGKCDAATCHRELTDALADLQRELGPRPRAFSFPWGQPGDYTDEAIGEAKRLGYTSVVLAYGGWNTRGSDIFQLLRVDVGIGLLSHLGVQARVAGLQPDYVRALRKLRGDQG
jgi:peptidoglycan/xylan/chitin deacetylase (PgdA/CDA1 family)